MDFRQPQVAAAIVAGLVALVTATTTALVTVALAERKLRRDFRLEFAAERVAHRLMSDAKWRLRSFDVIKKHVGGFEDDDLRRVLVRAGCIRFYSRSGIELWGLFVRNEDRLGLEQIDEEPGFRLVGGKSVP